LSHDFSFDSNSWDTYWNSPLFVFIWWITNPWNNSLTISIWKQTEICWNSWFLKVTNSMMIRMYFLYMINDSLFNEIIWEWLIGYLKYTESKLFCLSDVSTCYSHYSICWKRNLEHWFNEVVENRWSVIKQPWWLTVWKFVKNSLVWKCQTGNICYRNDFFYDFSKKPFFILRNIILLFEWTKNLNCQKYNTQSWLFWFCLRSKFMLHQTVIYDFSLKKINHLSVQRFSADIKHKDSSLKNHISECFYISVLCYSKGMKTRKVWYKWTGLSLTFWVAKRCSVPVKCCSEFS